MNPAVFLDRDNTLIHNDGDLGDPAQVRLIQGAASAIASLRGLGYKIVVVSNQGGVARGKFTEADVDTVHQKVNDLVKTTSATAIDRFYYCPYHPEGTVERYKREHPWRKPAPGMLLQAAKDLDLDLGQSWMIGDQMRDIEAGNAAGVRTILLRPDAEELTPLRLEEIASAQVDRAHEGVAVTPNFTARNLIEAVRIVAQQRKPEAPDEMRLREKTARKWDPQAARQGRAAQGGGTAPGVSGVLGVPAVPGAAARSEPSPPIAPSPPAAAATPPPPVAKPVPLRPVRPFKPWSAEGSGNSPGSTPPTVAPGDAVEPVASSAPAAPTVPVVVPVVTVAPSPAPAPSPPVTRTSPAATPPPIAEPVQTESGVETVLRQVLQELRDQRAHHADFTWLRFFAMVLQLFVLVCVGAALAMGQVSSDTFHRWIDMAMVLQLATVAALLFDR